MTAVPCLLKKITLARSILAIVNGKDKKHQPHDERQNLKRCEIKQLPNCWSGKPFKVSHFSLFPFPSLFLFLRHPPFVSRNVSVRFSPVLSPRRVATSPDHLSREILAFPSQFTLSLLQLVATSPTRPWMPSHTPLFLRSLPFSYPLCVEYVPERIWFDPIRRRRLPEANCGIIRRIPFG